MGLPLVYGPALGTFPFRLTNLAAFLEDLFHEIVSGKRSARAPPILGTSRVSLIGEQATDLFLECCYSLFKRRPGHGWTPTSKYYGI